MKTPASILRVPLHAVLGMIPVGLWIFANFCDFMFLYAGGTSWALSAFYAYASGTLVAVAAAVPGFIDHFALRGRAARRIGFFHMLTGLLVTVLMAISVAVRWFVSPESTLAIFVGSTGLIVLLVSTALALYMVHGLAIGVSTQDEEAVDEVPVATSHTHRSARA